MAGSDPLARVRRAAKARARAEAKYRAVEAEYRAAIVAAVDELTTGARPPFMVVAKAAGISRQAVRQLVERSR